MRLFIKTSLHFVAAVSVTLAVALTLTVSLTALAPNFAHAASGTGAFGGLSITPTATVDSGAVTFQVQNRVIGTGRYDGINLTNVFGLSDFLEVGGRIAANTTNVNLYTGDGGNRDLSASLKFQMNPIFGLASSPLKVSFGASDVGGAFTLFRSYYGVATYLASNWNASAGYAKAGVNNFNNNPLNGAFVNGSVSLKPWLDLQAESTPNRSWLALSTHNDSLLPSWGAPGGTAVYAKLNTQVRGTSQVGGKPWLDVGIRMPLDWTQIKRAPLTDGTLRQYANTNLIERPAVVNSRLTPNVQIKEAKQTDQAPQELPSLGSFAQELAYRLVNSGLEGVWVGSVGNTLVVKASDMVYEHSLLDGAGVALGQIAQQISAHTSAHKTVQIPAQITNYRYVHARWGTPAVGYSGDIACLQNWLARGQECSAEQAVEPTFRNLQSWSDQVNWLVQNEKDFRFKPRIKLNPVQNYYAATEFSLLDYSIGLNVQPSVLLWEGGSIELSKTYHLHSTKGYNPGEVFSNTRIRDGLNSIMLTHIQKLKDGFSGRINVGQIGTSFYKGGHAELRWDSLDGQFAAGFNQGYWLPNNNLIQGNGRPASVYARYAPPLRDWSLEMVAGKYWFGDKGISLASNHWFGDNKVVLFMRRSVPPEQFWPGKRGVTIAGIEVSFPLTPRRAMTAESFQIKGSPRLGLSLSTPVGRADNFIVDPFGMPIYVKALVDSPVSGQLGSVVMDYDRNGPAYVYGHLERLRYAYEKWVKKN
jgi:hypothetical protein